MPTQEAQVPAMRIAMKIAHEPHSYTTGERIAASWQFKDAAKRADNNGNHRAARNYRHIAELLCKFDGVPKVNHHEHS